MELREETFRRLYAAHFDAVLGYAMRRTERPEDAADVVAETARDWAILKEMAPEGDYPEVLWQIADDASRGKSTEWYKDGLGCQ